MLATSLHITVVCVFFRFTHSYISLIYALTSSLIPTPNDKKYRCVTWYDTTSRYTVALQGDCDYIKATFFP